MKYLFFALLFSSTLFAHPVTYKGGIVYWGSMMPMMQSHRINYSFSPKASLEINRSSIENINNYRDTTVGFNFLLKRWLQHDSQGNIYLNGHVGHFTQDNNKSGLATHQMVIGDWESRRIYTAGSIMNYSFDDKNLQRYSYRIGFAPYIGKMNELQTWMILKFDYFKENDRRLWVTPMMRFFYKNALWEFGANQYGDFLLTLMTHY